MCRRGSGFSGEAIELDHRLLARVAVAEGIDRPVEEIDDIDDHPFLKNAVCLDPADRGGDNFAYQG